MKFPKKITLARIAAHDFNRALRIWENRLPDIDILRCLVNERARALAIFIRSLGVAIIGTLWLSTAKGTLALKTGVFDLAIPVAYANLFVAATVFGALVQAINYMILNEFIRIASNKFFKFDAPWVLTVLQDGGSAWSIGAIAQFRFFRSSQAHNRFGSALALLLNLPMLAMFFFAYSINISVGIRVLTSVGILSSSGMAVLIGWLLIIYPLAHIALLRIPFGFEKNTQFIRWNFLTKIYRRIGLWPPRVNAWVEQAQAPATNKALTRREQIEAENEARTAELRRKYRSY
jgi:hypothetical protein